MVADPQQTDKEFPSSNPRPDIYVQKHLIISKINIYNPLKKIFYNLKYLSFPSLSQQWLWGHPSIIS